MDADGVTFLLVDQLTQLGLDRQLVRAVAEWHEGAAEGIPVDRSGDLDEASSAENSALQSVTTYVQPPLAGLLCSAAVKVLSSGP
jgi:hypothetical protein